MFFVMFLLMLLFIIQLVNGMEYRILKMKEVVTDLHTWPWSKTAF